MTTKPIYQEKIITKQTTNVSRTANIVKCNHCNEKFALEQGTILFDGDWYHEKCWNMVEEKHTSVARILIIGLGQIGYSNAEYISKLGYEVHGYDVSKDAVKRALDNGVIKKEATSFADYDYYMICISTHKSDNMFMPHLDDLYELAERIAKEGKQGALLGIDSTVPKGSTAKINLILGHKLHVAHVPHRFYIHEKEKHGVAQLRVLAGSNKCCTQKAIDFYKKMLHIPIHVVSSPEIAELTKITENAYRFIKIAFAEELKIVCDKLNIDFSELRAAVNTKWNEDVLEAHEGIGGHCLPKDSQMLLDLSVGKVNHSVIDAAKRIDYEYRQHIGQRLPRPLPLVK